MRSLRERLHFWQVWVHLKQNWRVSFFFLLSYHTLPLHYLPLLGSVVDRSDVLLYFPSLSFPLSVTCWQAPITIILISMTSKGTGRMHWGLSSDAARRGSRTTTWTQTISILPERFCMWPGTLRTISLPSLPTTTSTCMRQMTIKRRMMVRLNWMTDKREKRGLCCVLLLSTLD